ncbi:MAG: CocE/NonD family hydrolase [Planctomycetota bacterium]
MIKTFLNRFVLIVSMITLAPGETSAQAADTPAAAGRAGNRLTVQMPMRDKVQLAADLFLPDDVQPDGTTGKCPVILARTPYGRMIEATLYGEFFADHGYAFVAQDVRGRFESQGNWTPFHHEPNDGSDSIDWLVRQPWCDGRVAMFGASYGAMCAWYVAAEKHPKLQAVIAMVNVADPDQFMPFDNGAFHIGFAGWARLLEVIETTGGLMAGTDVDWNQAARVRPLGNLDEFFKTSHRYVDELLSKPLSDRAYWKSIGYLDRLSGANVAGLHITGWYDVHRRGTFAAYQRLRNDAATQEARNGQYLVVGPWAHLGLSRATRIGNVDFGPQSQIDLNDLMLRFLQRHLRGGKKAADMDHVRLFVTGTNQWQSEESWPLPARSSKKLMISSNGRANRRGAGGTLVKIGDEAGQEAFDEFTYDPDQPPDFLGSMALYPVPGHVADKSSSNDRTDVLDYTSEPLAAPFDALGTAKVVLHVSTSAADTDVAVELFRLTASGEMYRLTGGIQRLRYREGYEHDSPVQPGQVVAVQIECPPLGTRLDVGDRLHLQVASAATPAFAPHLNTLEPLPTATKPVVAINRIWHGSAYESYVQLSGRPCRK